MKNLLKTARREIFPAYLKKAPVTAKTAHRREGQGYHRH